MAFQNSFSIGSGSSTDSSHSPGGSSIPPIMSPWLPCSMPWTLENPPQLVRFGEQQAPENSIEWSNWCIPRPKLCPHKRKSDFDFNPKPTKMHITEEKVAAQLKNMHISNNHITEQGGFGNGFEKTGCALPTLVLSKEVQNLTAFHESLLPESLLPRAEKPTQALVLWKPPAGSITSQIISNLRNTDEEETDSANNNSENVDLNTMTSSTITELFSTGTDMDLELS